MRVELSTFNDGSMYGIRLHADNEAEQRLIERFAIGGVKINSVGHDDIQFTLADLIGQPESTKMGVR